MEGALVSAATGTLNPVLEKLGTLLGDEYRRFVGVRSEIKSLTDELAAMHAFLLKMSEEENPDAQDKAWMKEVRELSYDIEDSLDEFMVRVGDKDSKPDGFMEKCKNLFAKTRTRRRIAKAIEYLKTQVKDVADRHARYIRQTISKTSNETVDPRALAIFEDASKLVGVDGPKGELIELLRKKDGCASSQQLKVISIFGVGGLGKTTLAHQVYQDLKDQFECWAFVSVSRNPDMMNVLRNILSQVYECSKEQPYPNTEAADIQQLISKITDFLKDKRYLIVVDDIWKTDAWETINYALFKNSKHSRIITTTRIHGVAKTCCPSDGDVVYEMRSLSRKDSERLFLKRIFGCEVKCPSHLIDVSKKILEKCEGLPLAIISISSLLVDRIQIEEWDRVQKSIGCALEKNPHVERMMQILSFSYFDLPHHLKSCLLYLSIFPEDFVIQKKPLVRRWIAEGFIHEEQGHTLYELGERCFNELINRCLIQPWKINIYGEVMACRVHDTILDFIISKSIDENFVIISGDGYQIPGSSTKVRRLALHVSSPTELNLFHVRSLTVFKYVDNLPSLLDLRFLRVVDLEGCKQVEVHHLANIGNLFQLKYLSVRDSSVSELPEQIGKLQYLETLNLQKTKVTELPASIVRLQRLVHLVVDENVKLPDGIGSMRALQGLKCVNVFKQSIEFTQEIGKLTDLRKLRLFLRYHDDKECATGGSRCREYMDNIICSLCKLVYLHSLSILIDEERCADDFSLYSSLQRGLRKFIKVGFIDDERCADDFSLDSGGCAPRGLRKFISRVPNWMGSLIDLQWLTVHVKEFEVDDILVLGRFPRLLFLRLLAHKSFQGRRVTISGKDGFECLRHFDFGCAIPVAFEAGAMPKLEELFLLFSAVKTYNLLASNGDFPFGLQHLSSLGHVDCNVYEEAEMKSVEEGTKRAIERAVHAHPKSPKLKYCRTNEWWLDSTDSCRIM